MDACPLVSIIVPVYNVEPFCRKCFDSLLEIDYNKKEIILVDDCSTDGSGEICDDYSKKSKGIHVIHQKDNAGVAQARLTGTRYAHGEYVMFVDSDDYVDSQILNRLVEAMLSNHADLVSCQSYRVEGESLSIARRTIWGIYCGNKIMQFINNNGMFDTDLNYSGIPVFLWGKLFKKSDITISLEKGLGLSYGEDAIVFWDLLINRVNTLVCIDEPLYYYVRHPFQITQKPLYIMWPHYLKYWEHLDSLNTEEGWFDQLSRRIWSYIKPSIYYNKWGGNISVNLYISTFRALRNSDIVKKFIWQNKNLPNNIRRHPHYLLLRYRLYCLDYFMYALIWALPKR